MYLRADSSIALKQRLVLKPGVCTSPIFCCSIRKWRLISVQMRSERWRSIPGERISNCSVRLCGLWVTDALTTGELQGSTTARNLNIAEEITYAVQSSQLASWWPLGSESKYLTKMLLLASRSIIYTSIEVRYNDTSFAVMKPLFKRSIRVKAAKGSNPGCSHNFSRCDSTRCSSSQ